MREKTDTTNVFSSLAFVISQEQPFRRMCERIGVIRLTMDGAEVVFQAGPQAVEIGRGPTVRAALERAWKHWTGK